MPITISPTSPLHKKILRSNLTCKCIFTQSKHLPSSVYFDFILSEEVCRSRISYSRIPNNPNMWNKPRGYLKYSLRKKGCYKHANPLDLLRGELRSKHFIWILIKISHHKPVAFSFSCQKFAVCHGKWLMQWFCQNMSVGWTWIICKVPWCEILIVDDLRWERSLKELLKY